MTTVFLVCAAIGGTTLVMQFLLTLVGLGGHGLGGDMPHDISHGLDGAGHDGFDHDGFDHSGDADGDGDADSTHYNSTWLFGVLSFRTITAALAFFGLSGMAATSAGATPFATLAIAAASGLAAMYGVFWLMLLIKSIHSEGTAKIQRSLGVSGTVYLSIPAANSGCGKIQINLQNRTMEYLARTSGERIATGDKVVVTGVLTNDTVEVRRLEEQERN